MAPLRSHLYHLFKTLKSNRKCHIGMEEDQEESYFYMEHFFALEKKFKNFKFYPVLSEPLKEDNWKEKKDLNDKKGDGFLGFVHQAFIDNYLSKHENPEDIEFYFFVAHP